MADTKKLQSPDALKARFKAGSIPLQSDFADLIDLANAGAVAAGQAADQINNAGTGMKYGTTGKLELNTGTFNYNSNTDIEASSPVMVDSSNNKPVIDLAYGLKGSNAGLCVRAATGIVVNDSGVNVAPDIIANATAGAKAVGAFTGQDGNVGLGMKLGTDGKLGLNTDNSSYDYSTETDGSVFIAVDKKTNKPVLDLGKGLTRASSQVEVSVKAAEGIVVTQEGVAVDMGYVVPRGMIVMFWGSAVPKGWALCNGSNGTPDLRDRFVKGASGPSTSITTGGSKTNKYYPTGTVTVNPHTLTIAEMPTHGHTFEKINGVYAQGHRYPVATGPSIPANNPSAPSDMLGMTGGGQGHSHTATFKGADYNQNNEPQYYLLAYIMKL